MYFNDGIHTYLHVHIYAALRRFYQRSAAARERARVCVCVFELVNGPLSATDMRNIPQHDTESHKKDNPLI